MAALQGHPGRDVDHAVHHAADRCIASLRSICMPVMLKSAILTGSGLSTVYVYRELRRSSASAADAVHSSSGTAIRAQGSFFIHFSSFGISSIVHRATLPVNDCASRQAALKKSRVRVDNTSPARYHE